MIKKIEIIAEYKKKINTLKEHNKSYFNDDNPKISDANYDELKNRLFYLGFK